MTFGRWMALCMIMSLMGLLALMSGITLHRVISETGANFSSEVTLSTFTMRQVCFMLAMVMLSCIAAAVFLFEIWRGVRKDQNELHERIYRATNFVRGRG